MHVRTVEEVLRLEEPDDVEMGTELDVFEEEGPDDLEPG